MHLRWADLDAYGHVNNAVMLRLLEEARIRLMWRPAGNASNRNTQIFDGTSGSESLMVIAQQKIEYKRVMPYLAHPIDIQIWVGKLGGSSIDIYYEVFGAPETPEENTLYVRAMSTVVVLDSTLHTPRRLTDLERSVLQTVSDQPIVWNR